MVQDTERIKLTRIEDEMRDSYLDYAMSVIVSRALPDVRDGLKPVQRRILFGAQELGMSPNASFKKSARLIGDVMGKYHPHGDGALYDALVRLGQDFSLRYPLITPQGNFGSVDGDPPAQMRYTEAKLAPIAMELLADLDRNTVDFEPNFDDSMTQPVVLPSRIPNLLLNGASGIAVGMATNIPPYNLNEVIDAVEMVIDNPTCDVDDLMTVIHGPDFPTAATIFNRDEIRKAFATGRGKITMRAVIEREETETGRQRLIVRELPYQVNKATLIERIANLVRSKRIDGISDLRDESDREGMRVVIELGRNASYLAVRSNLYRHTALQSTFAVNNLALVDGQPRVITLKETIEAFINHRREVIRRRSEFDLQKAEERAHILEGLLTAMGDMDRVIALIRAAASADAAKTALKRRPLNLSDRQAQAVLDMQLRRLARLEREAIEAEHAKLTELITELEDILSKPERIDTMIKEDGEDLKQKYGDPRRTQVFAQPVEDISDEDLIAHQEVVVTISATQNYIKRVPLETYRTQGRGGRGITGMKTREEEAVGHLIVCDTHDSLLLFTQTGKVYSIKGYEVPEGSRQARGIPVVNLVEMDASDRVTAVVVVKDFSHDSLLLATAGGQVKRTPLQQFESVRRAGLITMRLDRGDELLAARAASDDDDVILISSDGQAIRFGVGTLRVASRASGGVRGMKLRPGAKVIALVVAGDGEDLLVVTEHGAGKRTPMEQYPRKGRGGQGMLTFRISDRTGPLAVARAVRADQEVILVSRDGIVMRTRAEQISRQGRTTQGVAVMNIGDDDAVASIAQIAVGDADEAAEETEASEDE